MPDLDYTLADRLLGGRTKREVACPICSANRKPHHRKLACLGLRRVAHDRIVYACAHCSAAGPLTAGYLSGKDRNQRQTTGDKNHDSFRRGTTPPSTEFPDDDRAMAEGACALWLQSLPTEGTVTETYWRARGLVLPIPPSIRHVSIRGSPVMLAAHGFDLSAVTSVQRTWLLPDGSWRDKVAGKKHLGPTRGKPCVVHVNLESLAVVIGEGIEKTHALAAAMNVDGWSAGGKSFMPALADTVPDIFECVTVINDPDADREVTALAERLDDRGIEVRIV
jgi:hypothetical protein